MNVLEISAHSLHSDSSLNSFRHRTAEEFIHGSGIEPALFAAAVQVVADTETLPGGEVSYPIHEALNWRITRFGARARASLSAALLLNEDGSTWQAKLNQPRQETKKDRHGNFKRDADGQPVIKTIKYESVVGAGSRVYLPPVPTAIRQRIAERYGVDVPSFGHFWNWLSLHPEIPIVFTEGGKKALCLLSLGYVAIALYGVNGGYRSRDALQQPIDPELIAEVARFAVPTRPIVLAFDQDTESNTRYKVNKALNRFGSLLAQAGCSVTIAQWQPEQGKGIDDLRVQSGSTAVQQAIAGSTPLDDWRITQWLNHRLTWTASLRLNVADLSTLQPQNLPESGIIAIASPKATGKTKFIQQQVERLPKVLSATHRVALGRNLSRRLRLDWRSDLDKTPDGRFITGSGYTLRVGFCVDSLLAIDPEQFRGCDLVIDEVCQVLRHLLTSSTTNQEGKRPALLARLRSLIQVARRVIVADADLDNGILHYLRAVRGEDQPIFLIRNDHQLTGYHVRLIEASDRSAITADLLHDSQSLPSGQVLLVVTDSKQTSKTMHRLLSQQCPSKRILVINAETSGGHDEREFVESPDVVLARYDYDIIICSPSVGTGVSIEVQGIIARVYGIFTGGSSTDADMAQALERVRDNVDRIVWCAQRGSNFSQISRSLNPLELKSHLQQRTSAVVSLIRSSLREDVQGQIASYDWQSDPWVNLFCRIEAERNRSMLNLRNALRVRLQQEGNTVTIDDRQNDAAARQLLQQVREELKVLDAEAILQAEDLTTAEISLLQQQENLSLDQQRAVSKFHLQEFYALDSLSLEEVLWDQGGRRRTELLNLEAQLHPEMAIERTVKGLEKQASWRQGVCPWDASGIEVQRKLRQTLRLHEFLDPEREWTKYDIAPYAAKIREHAQLVRAVLNFTVSPKVSDVQIVHQLLSQLGIKTVFRWSRFVIGHEGERLRVYRLEREHWQRLMAVLERRQARRTGNEADDSTGSPQTINLQTAQGDPGVVGAELAQWMVPEALAEVRQWWETADSEELRAEIQKLVPPEVLRRAIS